MGSVKSNYRNHPVRISGLIQDFVGSDFDILKLKLLNLQFLLTHILTTSL